MIELRMRQHKRLSIISLTLFILLLLPGGIARASFTLEDEKKLGKEFYDKLEKSDVLLQDRRVNEYINKLGNSILSHNQNAPFVFHFSVVKSSAINAFATPGGYIYVNAGLITLVGNESELAGVLAHEIAHVNARHIADIIAKSQKVGVATLAAILAGAFLGGGDVTAAVTGFSVATATSLNLKYSREHEEEADRMGMSYLTATGYDGKTMMDFLKKMRRYEFYSNTVPSYFLTHPGTDERIRYLDGLTQTRYRHGGAENIIGSLKRIQTILLLDRKTPDDNLKYFEEELKKNPNDPDNLYGLAVTLGNLGLTSRGLDNFQKALLLSPDDGDILREMGITYFKSGKTEEAIKFLTSAMNNGDKDTATILYLGKAYEARGDYATAIELYRKLLYTDDADIYYSIAMAHGKTGNKGDSHYYFGLSFKKGNKRESALFHFNEALKYYPQGSPRAQEIEKEIKTLKEKGSPQKPPKTASSE
ncbi:MAG: M48 family metalloprotease [Deltaproteobacteria bacterium]|nr:M48 family metalloprotease [Deltaproteobacteria bacterium]